MREGSYRGTVRVAVVFAATLLMCAAVRAAGEPSTLTLHVELIEQAACLTGPDEYRVSFELRTIYLNTGRAAVAIGLAGERVVGASFAPVVAGAAADDDRVAFAVPRGLDDTPRGAQTRIAIAEAGWAVTGHSTVSVPLSTFAWPPADVLTPGQYVARFEVRVPLREIGYEGHEASPGFSDVRVSTPPLTVLLSDPRQVQECGSFTLPLPPAVPE